MERIRSRLLIQTLVFGVAISPTLRASTDREDLLVSLDARDFQTGDRAWKQRPEAGGLADSFRAQGSPTRQLVAGAPAIVFDGHEDHFLGPATTARLHAPGAPHSVAVWVYQGNIRGEESLVSWGRRGGPDGSLAGFRYGSDPNNGAVSRWGLQDTPFATVPPAGFWHHLVFTYDGNYQYLYVNGALDSAREIGPVDAHDGQPIVVGAELRKDRVVEGRFTKLSGALSRVRIFGACLSASRVATLHDTGRPDFGEASAATLRQLPLHRFSPGGTPGPAEDGTRLPDSLGGVEMLVRGQGATLRRSGIHLGGGSSRKAAYLDLPNGIISAHRDVTIEIWSTQDAAAPWCRLLSVGTSSAGEIRAPGANFASGPVVSLCASVGTARVHRFMRTSSRQTVLADWRETAAYPASNFGTRFHDAFVYDFTQAHWFWYRNSILQECLPDDEGSTALDDLNVWLGRSEISSDANFQGEISEVRIYNYALSQAELLNNTLAGPARLEADGRARHFSWQTREGGSHDFTNTGGDDHWGTGPDGPHPDGAGTSASIGGDTTPLELNLPESVTLSGLSFSRPARVTVGGSDEAILALETSATSPTVLMVAPQSGGATISAPLQLSSPADFINFAAASLEISGNLSGASALAKSGPGPVLLNGSMARHEGPLEVRRGELILGTTSGQSLGNRQITTLRAGKLVFNQEGEVTFTAKVRGKGQLHHRRGGLAIDAEGQLSGLSLLSIDGDARRFENRGRLIGIGSMTIDSRAVFGEGSITAIDGRIRIGRQHPGHLLVGKNAPLVIDGPGQLIIGDGSKGLSSMTVAGGSVRFREILLGRGPASQGVLTLESGLLAKLPDGNNTQIGGSYPTALDAWGALVIRGGTFRSDGVIEVGAYGKGMLAVQGGECHLDANLVVGRFRTGPDGVGRGGIDVSGGQLTVGGENNFLIVGDEGQGTVTIRDGGRATCEAILLGAGTPENPGSGMINVLSNGELAAKVIRQINRTRARGILQLNGGTLEALADSGNFVSGLDDFWIGPAGGTINTGPFDLVIGMPIRKPSGFGLSTVPVRNGGSGFTAPPLITVTGGGGRGAAAVAEVRDRRITSIRVTSHGEGYQSPPRIEVSGSGSALELDTPTLSEISSGGLTKIGSGTLHLAAPCLISGPLVVAEGTLTTGPMFVGGRGNLSVEAGAVWTGSGVIEATVIVAPGATLSPDPDGGVTIEEDLRCGGTLELDLTRVTGQFLKVQGTLSLEKAKLTLAAPLRASQSGPIVIAQYGSLEGRFADDQNLPDGWTLDYQFEGKNRLALVRGAR